MSHALTENPILLLFVVSGLGYLLGRVSIRGFRLGVAGILFVGLLFGGLDAGFRIPETLIFLGLSIFVYSVGLKSGPTFFSTFRQRGLKDIYFIIIMLTISALIAAGFHYLFGFSNATTGGIFAGSTTNTPALAGLLDVISSSNATSQDVENLSHKAVVGYSLSYPVAIISASLAIQMVIKLLKVDFDKEVEALKSVYPVKQEINNETIEVTNIDIVNIPIRDIKKLHHWKVVFGRIERDGEVFLSHWDTRFELGDKVVIVGDQSELAQVEKHVGHLLPEGLEAKQSEYVTKRIFVSNAKIAGERIATLNLSERFAAIITRIRRGDLDLLANADTTIELGDQVQFIARRKDVSRLSTFFGDSFEALGVINLFSFGLGMALGLMLGMTTIQLSGGLSFQLGFAGGPITIALLLGALRRTGPIVWILPHGANTTLQQVGLILLLAGIGVNSGNTFFETLRAGKDISSIFGAGLMISFFTAFLTLVVGFKVMKIPFSILSGMVSTQPAILDFAMDKAGNKLPLVGYAYILPIALIIKILYVQLIYFLL